MVIGALLHFKAVNAARRVERIKGLPGKTKLRQEFLQQAVDIGQQVREKVKASAGMGVRFSLGADAWKTKLVKKQP